jgi:hypothetical protein
MISSELNTRIITTMPNMSQNEPYGNRIATISHTIGLHAGARGERGSGRGGAREWERGWSALAVSLMRHTSSQQHHLHPHRFLTLLSLGAVSFNRIVGVNTSIDSIYGSGPHQQPLPAGATTANIYSSLCHLRDADSRLPHGQSLALIDSWLAD